MLVDHPDCDCPLCSDEEADAGDGGEQTYKGYKDRYTSYYGVEWEEIRERVLGRADYECEECGLSNAEHVSRNDLFPPNGGLHVHHVTPAKEFESYEAANDLDNLQALCADCHREKENS